MPTKTRKKSTEPPCKKKRTDLKLEVDCYRLFRKIVSGTTMVDDAMIESITRCNLPDTLQATK